MIDAAALPPGIDYGPIGALLLDAQKASACLATTMPDGTPDIIFIWFDYVNGYVRINLSPSPLTQALLPGVQVALDVLNPADPYDHRVVKCQVVGSNDGVVADAHLDFFARKYLNEDRYPWRNEGFPRVQVILRTISLSTTGSPP